MEKKKREKYEMSFQEIQSFSIQNVVHSAAGLTSVSLEMLSQRFHPDLLNQNLHFNKIPR